MDTTAMITTGMTNEAEFVVEEQHLAQHIGSGSIGVLSTPSMIGFMERVSLLLLASALPENYSSVGTRVDVRHLAPTPLGATVRVRAEVTAVDGNKITLAIKAWDEKELIGEGQHYRMVIDLERFMKRVSAKTGSM